MPTIIQTLYVISYNNIIIYRDYIVYVSTAVALSDILDDPHPPPPKKIKKIKIKICARVCAPTRTRGMIDIVFTFAGRGYRHQIRILRQVRTSGHALTLHPIITVINHYNIVWVVPMQFIVPYSI